MDNLNARVARGAQLLDRCRPGWYHKIALDRLAMESCDACILGQLYGDYFQGFRNLLQDQPSTLMFSAQDHGFTISEQLQLEILKQEGEDAARALFAPLAEAWRAEIQRRRDAQTQSDSVR